MRRSGWRADGVVVFGVVLGACILTLCRTIYWGDSVELAGVARTGGVAHPSGYPLWSLISTLWARLWPGDGAVATNLLSAIGLATAAALLCALVRRLGAGTIGSVCAGLCFALMPAAWSLGSVAEVYSWHVAASLLLLWFALQVRRSGSTRDMTLLGLCAGLALANHMTTVLLAPAVLGLILLEPRARPRPLGYVAGAVAMFAALSCYLWLPWRGGTPGPFVYGETGSLDGFLYHLSGAQFHFLIGAEGETGLFDRWAGYFAMLWRDLRFVGIPLAVVGWVWLYRRHAAAAIAMLTTFLIVAGYATWYIIPDPAGYFLVASALVCVALGMGITAVQSRFPDSPANRWVAGGLCGLFVVAVGWRGYSRADHRPDRSLEDLARVVVKAVPDDAVILTEELDMYYALEWLKLNGEAPDSLLPRAEYLMRLPWYIDTLDLPTEQKAALRDAVNRLEEADLGEAYGTRSAAIVERTRKLVIERHLGTRPIFLFAVHRTDLLEERDGYFLRVHSVLYEVLAEDRSDDLFATPYPSPDEYNTGADTLWQRRTARRFATAMNRLGIAQVDRGELEQAIPAFELAARYDREYAGAWYNLGAVLGELGRVEESREAWRTLLRVKPDYPNAAKVLGEMTAQHADGSGASSGG